MTLPSTARTSVLVILGAAGTLLSIGAAGPSSHREAPLVTEMPKIDATDFYMFTSYEPGRSGYVTLIANYLPLQDPYGGPNYFTLDPEARYELRVDNDGDAVEDVTFRFRFDNLLRDVQLPIGPAGAEKLVSVPLRNVGAISAGDESKLNELETYRLDVVLGSFHAGETPVVLPVANARTGARVFSKPVDHIGEKSIPDYASYAASKVYDIELPDGSTGRMFVGQRKDPFVVNLGETFDLVNLNPLGAVNGEKDDLADANVTSLILEIPKSFLTGPGQPVIGGWTAALLPKNRVLKAKPTYDQATNEFGEYLQVSRLGSPLVNEVVIGLKDKDRFNASQPKFDAQFADYVTNPTLPALLEILFGVRAPTLFPRADLVQAFATGLPGLNANGAFGEMLRLNTATPARLPREQEELGALAGDFAGFPNGRRPGDDVVDIELRVAMGALLSVDVAPDGQLPYTDGAFVDASFFAASFPYLRDPLPGSPQD